MMILSHRGYWRDVAEKNTPVALQRSVAHGFGTETDIRDHDGALVVSHDPPLRTALGIGRLIEIFRGSGLELALNVKADGLAAMLHGALAEAGIAWFAFDMSGPETVRYARAGLPVFTRHSEHETSPICYDRAVGVWLDAFEGDWFDAGTVRGHLDAGKRVCVVSPELHGRAPDAVWGWLASSGLNRHPDVLICTDHPGRAAATFGAGL